MLNIQLKAEHAIAGIKGLGKYPENNLPLLAAYQRLLKISPQADQRILLALLKEGIQSALQVATIPRQQFLSKFKGLFNNEEKTINQFYNNAQVIKTRILLQFMNRQQNQEVKL